MLPGMNRRKSRLPLASRAENVGKPEVERLWRSVRIQVERADARPHGVVEQELSEYAQ